MEFRKQDLLEVLRGHPEPYGAIRHGDGVNFAIFIQAPTSVSLCLFENDSKEPVHEIELDPTVNRTGEVWHTFVRPIPDGMSYAYRVNGVSDQEKGRLYNQHHYLLDPYAKGVRSKHKWPRNGKTTLSSTSYQPRGVIFGPTEAFDWQGDSHPNIPMEELVIYEMHVRGFTADESSGVNNKGTFLGIIDKIPHLKRLGVNAVELMPVHEFNECEYHLSNPETEERLYNYWGYSTVNFFSPMGGYIVNEKRGLDEFRTMVRELHKNGIEIFLDVVFNHTAEGNERGPFLSFRGLANPVYYMLDNDGHYLNFSGCGNTFNCNHPVVRELIRDSLRYWVSEMHVDGFRFDLASILGRAKDGTPLESPPLIESISLNPTLSHIKLIAEAWDAGGLYQVGSFPSWGEWAEWNGEYRDTIRDFIKGTADKSSLFATRISGSEDLYEHMKTPSKSVNFVTVHDGFTLADLVSYNDKHNLLNGEENKDGNNYNTSWNCGVEGVTEERDVVELRQRQMRNFHLALMVSQGTPMVHMGDEYAHTKLGNNNTWCQDNELNWFLWNQLEKNKAFFRFFRLMIAFRRKHRVLRSPIFLTSQKISWYDSEGKRLNWKEDSRFVAFVLNDTETHQDLYIAFNAFYKQRDTCLPPPSRKGSWYRIVDTSLPSPLDFIEDEQSAPQETSSYTMPPYSALIFKTLH
ncbi:glycogen debranching protein GlgX [Simkania negevensis]|uniref:Glycogen debranching protein GlgX n=1 Tax=Simkania negevensis TaxID=83561 RepID=A0ABS3AR52_9BACT|nr:glycogen debranching protein GlgX [Simkania negevensis]